MATDIAQDKTDKQLDKERRDYIKREFGELINKTIVGIRPLKREECEALAWEYGYERDAFVVILNDDSCFIPMADPEGNGAGFLMLANLGAS